MLGHDGVRAGAKIPCLEGRRCLRCSRSTQEDLAGLILISAKEDPS